MKALSAALFAALFGLAAVASHAAVPAFATGSYNSEEKTDDAKSPTPPIEQKDEEEKKKDEDSKS